MAAEPYHLSDQATTAAAAAAAAPPGELHTPRTCTHRALCAPFGLHMGSGILDILLEFLQVSELSLGLYHAPEMAVTACAQISVALTGSAGSQISEIRFRPSAARFVLPNLSAGLRY